MEDHLRELFAQHKPSQAATPRGAQGSAPTKTVTLKTGQKVTDPDWRDVVLVPDRDPRDVRAIVDVRGTARLRNVRLRCRLEFEGNAELDNIWATERYAVPVLPEDPDMQSPNNHKTLSFGAGRVQVRRMTLLNNDDCIQLGKRVNFSIYDSDVNLVLPYIGDHRDTLDVDDCALVEIINTHLRDSGNSPLFCKQEDATKFLDRLTVRHSRIDNYKEDDPSKRQGHLVWLGYQVKVAVFEDNTFDARPVQTLLVSKDTKLTNTRNVYWNSAPGLTKRVPPRRQGQPIDITYHLGQ
jgi:hypothetical protein